MLMALLLCVASVTLGICGSFFGIDVRQKNAEKYIGEHAVKMSVIEEERCSKYYSAYVVETKRVDDEYTSFKTLMVMDFMCKLEVGDTVYANANLVPIDTNTFGKQGSSVSYDEDVLLMSVVGNADEALVDEFDRSAPLFKRIFMENGPRAVLSDIKDGVAKRASTLLGSVNGSLARGFLIGDTSDIPTIMLRDFRRSGASHLLAVSGMHISVILAAVEMIFRRMFFPKSARIVIVSFLAFVLLCLTGFSMSALRAVLMLGLSYVFFLFSEEADAPTVLSISIATIILIFPYAIYDIGMWMSFFATLGIVTLYPLAKSKLPKPKHSNKFLNVFLTMLREMILAATITIVANMFLLFIMCTVFGEFSLSAVPTNIILSPLSTVFMFLSTAVLLFGGVPLVGKVICFACGGIGRIIIAVSGWFSSFEWSVISLRFTFAKILVALFVVALAVLLLVRLKRKWIFSALPMGFAVIFGVCLACHCWISGPVGTYLGESDNGIIYVNNDLDVGIVDMSKGTYSDYREILNDAKQRGACEVKTIAFTTLRKSHLSTMDYIFRSSVVRDIYIPMPSTDEEIELSLDLVTLAKECGVRAHVYTPAQTFELLEDVYACAATHTTEEDRSNIVFMSSEDYMFGYVDDTAAKGFEAQTVNSALYLCDTVLIGGGSEERCEYAYTVNEDADVMFLSQKLYQISGMRLDPDKVYVNPYKRVKFSFKME
jgi:ComEC/Rec2-related protein